MTEKNNKECIYHQNKICDSHCSGYCVNELDYGLVDGAVKGHCVRLAVEGNAARCMRLINDAATREFIRHLVSQIRNQRTGDF